MSQDTKQSLNDTIVQTTSNVLASSISEIVSDLKKQRQELLKKGIEKAAKLDIKITVSLATEDGEVIAVQPKLVWTKNILNKVSGEVLILDPNQADLFEELI